MSASMRQGIADLLVRRTSFARNKASDLLVSVRKDLGATAKHAEHKRYSDIIASFEKHLLNAETLLHKCEVSYFDYLRALRNLELLQDVTRDIVVLANHYAQRQQRANQVIDADERLQKIQERHIKCEAEQRLALDVKIPDKTYHDAPILLFLAVLAVLVGYFIVGYEVGKHEAELERRDIYDGTVRLLSFFIWPLFTGLPAVLDAVFKGNFDLMRALVGAIFLGFAPAATIAGFVALKRITSNARYNAKKARYDKARQRLRELGDEQKQLGGERAKLTEEIAGVQNNLKAVDHEISGYKHRIAQKMDAINWK